MGHPFLKVSKNESMRWAIVILWVCAVVAHAAPPATRFEELARKADEARKADRLSEAVPLFQRALKLRPGWSEGWWWLGSIYYDQDLYAEARDAFQHSIAGSPKAVPTYAFVGLCDYELRDYAAARANLNKWVAAGAPGDARIAGVARFRWEELLIQNGLFFEALFQLNKDVRAHGPNPSLIDAMGLAWMQMKDVPENYPPEKRELVWLAGSAAAWMSAEKMDRSREYLDRLAAHYGDRPNVHFLRGFAFESIKDNDAASAEYLQELKIAPDAIAPMIQLALLDLDAGQEEAALQLSRQAVMLEPNNPRCHFALGRALTGSEQWAEGASELEKAKALSPNASKVRYQLARAYRKLGRTEDANREMAAFQSLDKKVKDQTESADPSSLMHRPEQEKQ